MSLQFLPMRREVRACTFIFSNFLVYKNSFSSAAGDPMMNALMNQLFSASMGQVCSQCLLAMLFSFQRVKSLDVIRLLRMHPFHLFFMFSLYRQRPPKQGFDSNLNNSPPWVSLIANEICKVRNGRALIGVFHTSTVLKALLKLRKIK